MNIGNTTNVNAAVLNKGIPTFWKCVIAIVLCEAIGGLSGLITASQISTWYTTLNKPSWNPPSAVFGPVWTSLYFLMGISLGLVWSTSTERIKEKTAIWLFAFQLFLNFWWSVIFFRFHSPGWAFIEIILLLASILATYAEFKRINKVAGWLLIPYILWVCFATVLNAAFWQLNSVTPAI